MTTTTRTYVVRPIPADVVAQLRVLDDAGHTPVTVVDADGGSPLRCCLRVSRPGDDLLVASYAPVRRWAAAHGADPAAYDEVGPVFIHPQPCDGAADDAYPSDLRGTPRVLRAYSADARIIDARVLGAQDDPHAAIEALLADPQVAFVHARALGFGCYTFAVERAAF